MQSIGAAQSPAREESTAAATDPLGALTAATTAEVPDKKTEHQAKKSKQKAVSTEMKKRSEEERILNVLAWPMPSFSPSTSPRSTSICPCNSWLTYLESIQ